MPAPLTANMKRMSATHPLQTMRGHTSWVTGVAHLADRRRTITCSHDSSLRLWNLQNGAQVGNDWRDDGNEGAVWSISLSPNGKTVASGSRDGKLRLWDVETEKVVAKWTGHPYAACQSLCWSADGERLESGSGDGTVRVWDVKSRKTVLGPIKTGHRYVHAVIYSPDTTKIATGGDNEHALCKSLGCKDRQPAFHNQTRCSSLGRSEYGMSRAATQFWVQSRRGNCMCPR